MKLFLSFILLLYLAGLICAICGDKLWDLTETYALLKSKVPEHIKNTLESLTVLTENQKANAEDMDTFKTNLFSKNNIELSSDEMKNLFNTEGSNTKALWNIE